MADEHFYERAVEEYKSGRRDAALAAKAYALAKGDEKAQEFEYIKLRVAQLRAEHLKATARDVAATATSHARTALPWIKRLAWAALAFVVGFIILAFIVG